MKLEQTSPDQPKFTVVVILFCATILTVFVLALLFIHFDGSHLTFRHHHAHPTSQLLPATTIHPKHTIAFA